MLVALSSTVRQFFEPAHDSVLPDVADDAALESANSFMSISSTASSVLGFAAAGLLASSLRLNLVFWLDALTFIIGGTLLLGVAVPHHASGDEEGVRTVLGDIRSGLAHLFGTPLLRAIYGLSLIIFFVLGMGNALFLPFVLSKLPGGSEFVFGLQEGAMSLGFVLGSVVMASFASRMKERGWISLCLLGMGAASLVYALNTSVPLTILLAGLIGVFNAPAVIAIKTVFQRKTPPKLRGRVLGASYVGVDTMMVLGLLVGGLGDIVGIRTLLAVSALLTLLLGFVAANLSSLKTSSAPEGELEGAVPTD